MPTPAETIKSLYASFAKGDIPAVLAAFHPEIQWSEAEGFLYADGNPYSGPQRIAEGVFGRIAADMDGFAVRPHNFIDGGDTIAVEGRYQATMKATGRPINSQFVHIWKLNAGKVIRFQQYTDTKQWSAAAGI